MRIGKVLKGITGLGAGLFAAGAVWAQDGITGLESIGKPVPEGLWMQPAATELAQDIHWLNGLLHWIMLAITLFVVLLLLIVIVRHNSRANPNPSRFTHHSALEFAWTAIPVVILVVIGSFSLPVLFKQVEIPDSDMTIKVTGHQWYWSYEYPDSDVEFSAFMLARDELAAYGYADDEWLLATDMAMVVPVGAVVRLQITASDVIHSWTIPSFGVKMDAIPGRLNETWFRADIEGVYFGQCSELCGKDHSYMPITVKVVSQSVYDTWLAQMQGGVAMAPAQPGAQDTAGVELAAVR